MIPSIEAYEQFCNKLVSPCTLPLGRRDATRFHLAHMLIGIAGEILEIVNSPNQENLKDELGDVLFYRTNLISFSLIDPRYLQGIEVSIIDYEDVLDAQDTMTGTQIAEQFIDIAKREFFYGQTLPMEDLMILLAHFDQWFIQRMDQAKVNQSELIVRNMEKLQKRYEKGTFSKQESIDKRDGT